MNVAVPEMIPPHKRASTATFVGVHPWPFEASAVPEMDCMKVARHRRRQDQTGALPQVTTWSL